MENADRIPKLDKDPRIHLTDWIIAVKEVAGSYGTTYHPSNGWLDVGILTTEIQWRSAHNNECRPFPQMTAKPDDDSTAPAAYHHYKSKLNEARLFRDDQRILKDLMIRSLGADVAEMLRDPTTGFANLDPADIMARLIEEFGELSEADIAVIRKEAESEISSAIALPGKIAKMKNKLKQLEHCGQGISEVDKMAILTSATAKFPAAVLCIQQYKIKYTKLRQRSFAKMSDYLIRHIEANQHDITVQDAGYGAAAAVKRIEQLEQTIATLTLQQQQQQQQGTVAAVTASSKTGNSKTAAAAGGGAGDESKQDRNKNKRRANNPPAPDNYCWTCGYNFTHDGSECFIMRNGGSDYTAAMKKAKHPYSIPGSTGNVEMKSKKRPQA